ncbi:MAG TPA: peptidoglycan DD-metalloendopeptidase family protein [Gammaproteobacteria bacterium]|nr:peptidoglycan DD-metalloendopeptidase family protein [Gammaproteobacteria bacterium]
MIKGGAGKLVRAALVLSLCVALAGCINALRWRNYDYVVQPGDTLYSVAWHFDVNYRDLAQWNHIPPPYTIHPGERLVLSRAHARYATPAPETVPPSSGTVARNKPSPSTGKPETSPATRVTAADTERRISTWRWPAAGSVVDEFDPNKVNGKGIDIAGKLGEPVRATAAGRVVYSGNGLAGYGELIIIKHNNHYLSAYAHNRQRLVQEGDEVKAGQTIATMGRGNDGKALLHFEIRDDGKPVDPMRYLPSRH